MKIVIVESPTKAKTIGGFLGSGYRVYSSYGHIRDLPKSKLGVDVDKNFKPKYVIPRKSQNTVRFLKKKVKDADEVILATDEDREGEAIAWHLAKILNLDKYAKDRIVFHEITKRAINEALKNPRKINENLVDAQKARRVLDRLVGYKLSPFLWKKIFYGLSAGRVQSVALRLICDRESEIEKFEPEQYWTIEGVFSPGKRRESTEFNAKLFKIEGNKLKKLDIKDKKQAQDLRKNIEKKNYKISEVEKKEKKRHPFPPFITATLQQDASYRLGFSSKKTMYLAQRLYEGMKLDSGKQTGLITYHRTDSITMAPKALAQAKKVIKEQWGDKYLHTRQWKTKAKGAQQAHEAIRPTSFWRKPEEVKKYLKKDEFKLYELIYQRGLASQMSPALLDKTKIIISSKDKKFDFKALGQILKFDGFLKVYPIKTKQERLPDVKKGTDVLLQEVNPSQHFTKPPPRYTEASLIKKLKDNGVGRPSTYAPIMDTIRKRNYVRKEGKSLVPTKIGQTVNRLLADHFPQIVDIEFTAKMEEDLDEIAQGKKDWPKVVADFYGPFSEKLEKKRDEISKKELTEESIDEKCPQCGAPLVKKLSRKGEFISCSRFPECKYARPIIKKTGVKCPECKNGEIVERKTKKGKTFYGCSNYPDCEFALWAKPTGEKCPRCGSLLVESKSGKTIYCPKKECKYKKKA